MREIAITCVALVSVLWSGSVSAADEKALFRLKSVRAFIELLYRKNEINNQATGIETTIDDSRSQIKIGTSTTSYIFHPKLLQIHLGGSLLSDRQDVIREQFSLATNETTLSDSIQKQTRKSAGANGSGR